MVKPLRVLHIEDSEDDAELITRELARGGLSPQVHRVEDEDAMQAALDHGEWDLVLCDYQLAGFGAEQALEVLQRSGKDLPFIILSGVVQAEDVVALLKRGAHDFLSKDSLARLVPAIERELREVEVRAHHRLAEERVRILSLAIEQSPVSVVITNRDGRIDYVNPKFQEVSGYPPHEAVGRSLEFTRPPDIDEVTFSELWATVNAGQAWRGEFCSLRRDGQLFWEQAIVSPLKDEQGEIAHFIAVKEDVTVRRSYEERLLRQANFDDLTGLPNRVLMLDRLDQAIGVAKRKDAVSALLFIDLDNFKNINDLFGHAAGDALLREAASRLGECIREGETLARLGGDEFVVILPGIADGMVAQRIAERVVQAFSQPFLVLHNLHYVTASVGVALYPMDGADHQVLLRKADLAMYKAKELGRNGYHFFTHEIEQRVQERLGLEARLRSGLRHGEMVLHYQPVVDLQNETLVAVEALLRWRELDGELLLPGRFIPIAEEIGLIREIGEWVLASACRERHSRFGGLNVEPRLAVNVSPRQLQSTGFAHYVQHVLQESGLPSEQLELELTESVLMDDTPETVMNLTALSDLGVRLSIDDFGTGYSSLGYLQRYPFQTLKIDRSFVRLIPQQAKTARLVETIINMAHGLGMEVIAEGVETSEQLEFLRSRGCDMGQGFLIARPVPVSELPAATARALQELELSRS